MLLHLRFTWSKLAELRPFPIRMIECSNSVVINPDPVVRLQKNPGNLRLHSKQDARCANKCVCVCVCTCCHRTVKRAYDAKTVMIH